MAESLRADPESRDDLLNELAHLLAEGARIHLKQLENPERAQTQREKAPANSRIEPR